MAPPAAVPGPPAAEALAELARLRPAQARVDLDRLRANYRAVAALAGRPLMSVVKADAYGHGAARVARVLEAEGTSALGVACVEEGVALRRAGLRAPIVVLAGFTPAQIDSLVASDLVAVVSSAAMAASLREAASQLPRPLAVHLEVDTGMHRLGLDPADLARTARDLLSTGRLAVEGVMTHLAGADEDADFTEEQLDRFDEAVADLLRSGLRPRWVHAAASAGLAYLRPTHTLARPGLLLYGLRPRPRCPEVAVRPVMTLAARVFAARRVGAGEGVSYGRRFVTRRPSRLAVLPLGYADGVPRTRAMAEEGSVAVAGRRVPVAGTVCMDLTMLDLTDHPGVGEGDEAVVFGDDPPAWELAERAGTSAWEVPTRVGHRVPRVYLQDGAVVAVDARCP
jgi:alanine racemase